jgi:tetratricopeptide (TPR) repeat protein
LTYDEQPNNTLTQSKRLDVDEVLMKKIYSLGLIIVLIMPIAASPFTSTLIIKFQQSQDEVKGELYLKFHTKFEEARREKSSNPASAKNAYKEAYQIAKEYLQKFPNDNDDIANYLRKIVTNYEEELVRLQKEEQKSQRKQRFLDLLYKDQQYTEAFSLGKEILREEPDDLTTLVNLANVAHLAPSQNGSLRPDAINFIKRSIQMIEAGKTFEPGIPFPEKEKRLGRLYMSLGMLISDTNPREALDYLYKAAQNEETRKMPVLYEQIAAAYYAGDYKRLSDDYNARFLNKPETEESKAALAQLNKVIDLIIDAYARAMSYSSGDPKLEQSRENWMQQLTAFYKFRHDNSDAGLKDLIANITAKPLPRFDSIVVYNSATPSNMKETTNTIPANASANGARKSSPVTVPGSKQSVNSPRRRNSRSQKRSRP